MSGLERENLPVYLLPLNASGTKTFGTSHRPGTGGAEGGPAMCAWSGSAEAAEHFAWLTYFAVVAVPASSDWTPKSGVKPR